MFYGLQRHFTKQFSNISVIKSVLTVASTSLSNPRDRKSSLFKTVVPTWPIASSGDFVSSNTSSSFKMTVSVKYLLLYYIRWQKTKDNRKLTLELIYMKKNTSLCLMRAIFGLLELNQIKQMKTFTHVNCPLSISCSVTSLLAHMWYMCFIPQQCSSQTSKPPAIW